MALCSAVLRHEQKKLLGSWGKLGIVLLVIIVGCTKAGKSGFWASKSLRWVKTCSPGAACQPLPSLSVAWTQIWVPKKKSPGKISCGQYFLAQVDPTNVLNRFFYGPLLLVTAEVWSRACPEHVGDMLLFLHWIWHRDQCCRRVHRSSPRFTHCNYRVSADLPLGRQKKQCFLYFWQMFWQMFCNFYFAHGVSQTKLVRCTAAPRLGFFYRFGRPHRSWTWLSHLSAGMVKISSFFALPKRLRPKCFFLQNRYIAFSIVLVGIIPYHDIDAAAPAEDAFGPRYANIPWATGAIERGEVVGKQPGTDDLWLEHGSMVSYTACL